MMPNKNPKPNYAAQGATAEQATLLSRQADVNAQQPQSMPPPRRAVARPPAQGQTVPPRPEGVNPVAPETRTPQTVTLTPNDYGPQGLPPGDPDDMNFLYADPKEPASLDAILQGAQGQMYSRDTPVPVKLLRYLPILRQMAYDKDAPASVQAFYRHLVDSIERRRTR